MSDSPVTPPAQPTAGPPSSPRWPPPPTMTGLPAYRTPAQSNELVAPRTSGWAIFGGFVITGVCAVLTFLQLMSALLGLAFDAPTRDQTADEIRYGKIFFAFWTTSFVAAAMTAIALGVTIAAASNRERRVLRWVFLPLVVNLVLCVTTWGFGLASIPD